MSRARRVALAVALLGIVPGTAGAHETVGRFAAPVPLDLLFGGAAATVAVTALLLAVAVAESPADSAESPAIATVPPSAATAARAVARGLFFAAFLLTILAGLRGAQSPAENFATVFLWSVWLKGLALVAALVGSPWPVLSPWRALYDGLVRLEGDRIAVLGDYPRRLGSWPALGGFLVWIGIVENLTVVPRSPRLTALLVAGYAFAMLAGGLAFGRRWFERADALAVLYRLFGRVAPVAVESAASGGYRVRFRPPWRGCLRPVSDLASAAFVVAAVYTVSFDGFTGTPEFQALLFAVRDLVGVGRVASVPLYLLGFAGFVAAFVGAILLAHRLAGGGRAGKERADRGCVDRERADREHADRERTGGTGAVLAFAPTALPIAVAYEIAHNYPFVLGSAGRTAASLGTFLGVGGVPAVDPLAWLSIEAYWWSQVLLIVAGHLVAVVAAHYVVASRYPAVAATRRGHVPLTVLMVGYTVLSLWIVSRPIVA